LDYRPLILFSAWTFLRLPICLKLEQSIHHCIA